jgi:hypothetical protein
MHPELSVPGWEALPAGGTTSWVKSPAPCGSRPEEDDDNPSENQRGEYGDAILLILRHSTLKAFVMERKDRNKWCDKQSMSLHSGVSVSKKGHCTELHRGGGSFTENSYSLWNSPSFFFVKLCEIP